jgi:hypothetical protein
MWLLWAVKKKKRRNAVNSEFGDRFWKIRPIGHYSPVLLAYCRANGRLTARNLVPLWYSEHSERECDQRRCGVVSRRQ